jgi:hypothetical protein
MLTTNKYTAPAGGLLLIGAIVLMLFTLTATQGTNCARADQSCGTGNDVNIENDLAFASGTAFDVTLGHAATAARAVTFGDYAGELTINDAAQALTNKTNVSSAAGTFTTLGVGSALTEGTLHVNTATAGGVTANASLNDLVVENNDHGGISVLVPDNKTGYVGLGSPADSFAAGLSWNNGANTANIGTSIVGGTVSINSADQQPAITIDGSQDVTFAGNAGFTVGSDPGGTANTAHVYAKDVTASAEIFVRDEAGNVTQISPHDPNTNHWYFNSCNDFSGRCVQIDMEAALEALGALTGQTLITESFISEKSRLDWDTVESEKQTRAQAAIDAWGANPAPEGSRPDPYTPRRKPAWLTK